MPLHRPILLDRVEIYIKQEHLVNTGDTIIVGVSGGPDSVTLLDLLYHLREDLDLTLHVAHLNHQLRPTAQSDADFVRSTAEQYGLPVYIHTEDIKQRAKSSKQSLEEAARFARRDFLETVSKKINAHRIALGHTKSDQAETVLMRLIRGAGLTGLGGIRPKSDDKWIRPLLHFTRSEIEAYVATQNLEIRHDETNTDPTFFRNRIRQDLMPQLQDHYNAQIEDTITRTSTLLQDDDAYLEIIAQQAFSKTLLYRDNRKIILDVTRFFGYHVSLRRRLIRIALFELRASPKSTEFRAIKRIFQTASQPGRKLQIESQISVHRTTNTLIISRPAQPYHIAVVPDKKIEINGQFTAQILQKQNSENLHTKASNTEFFDLDQLPSQELFIRSPQPGDKFQPFGLQGNKKISRLLNDHKIPRPIRDEIPLLISGGTILWVVGLRRAQIAPVTPATLRVLKTTFDSKMQSII